MTIAEFLLAGLCIYLAYTLGKYRGHDLDEKKIPRIRVSDTEDYIN